MVWLSVGVKPNGSLLAARWAYRTFQVEGLKHPTANRCMQNLFRPVPVDGYGCVDGGSTLWSEQCLNNKGGVYSKEELDNMVGIPIVFPLRHLGRFTDYRLIC